ncbi:hypothetical protein SK3146_06253 [Paenibacillus konkukensis]|uniref:Uncharacterized protein n=1 Tax=Paenibacillus konkukensis TaxID=2020716 RepID=A0ABY4RYW8_9BACL|nr:hypothetical protein [Paenibacillus konkukensis]UQZ86960.1 hypothetical protein SK3146_06253 [Paenibacillus konkukensis]
MKWTAVTVNLSKYRKAGQDLGIYFRIISYLVTGCILFFIILGMLGYAQSKWANTTPTSSMKGLAASVSSHFFTDMLGMELPQMKSDKQSFTFSQSNVAGFLFSLVTDLNLKDPKTFIAREMPGMAEDRSVILRKTTATRDDGPRITGRRETPFPPTAKAAPVPLRRIRRLRRKRPYKAPRFPPKRRSRRGRQEEMSSSSINLTIRNRICPIFPASRTRTKRTIRRKM